MARKKKGQLPSGNVRVQVYDYTDANGKRHYQSFTAATKSQAQALANEWKVSRKEQHDRTMLIKAVRKYIDLKEHILSPSTIKAYNSMYKNLRDMGIASVELRDLDNHKLQRFVSELSVGHTPKYVKNYYGLISAALKVYMPDFTPRVKFAQAKHSELYTPTDDDVQALLNNCKTTEAKLGILFGAIGFMRRGEACAVEFTDVDRKTHTIAVTKSMVSDSDNLWIVKEPKTFDSYRKVMMPEYVFDMIDSLDRSSGTVLNMDPSQLYKAFSFALRHAEVPHFRFHDLRHHAATYAHNLNISDRNIEKMGGWRPNSSVLKRVYENVIDSELIKSQELFLDNQKFEI